VKKLLVFFGVASLHVLCCAGKQQSISDRFSGYKKNNDTRIYRHDSSSKILTKDQKKSFIEIDCYGERCYAIPARLVGDKLQRYFSRTSQAVVAMSCCSHVHVHRRCLQEMLHEDKNFCPGCQAIVDARLFGSSRSQYLLAHLRKSNCDFCSQKLK